MKLLIENWRRFVEGQRPHYRLVTNTLTELTEQQIKDFPLSDEELARLKDWGKLIGQPSFLGSGTMGSAYLFDDNKVLKITSDYKEAQAAKLIEGEDHPNVYKVYKVGRRWKAGQQGYKEESRRPFIIIYEMVGKDPRLAGLVNFPTEEQKPIIKKADATVDRYNAWRNWPDNFESAKEEFLKAAEKYDLEGEVIPKFKSEEDKLDSILDQMEGDKKDKAAIKLAYTMSVGVAGNNLSSMNSIKDVVESDKFEYVEDLASGLTFLKSKGISFQDLKTSNVMNVDNKLIIIDIGKSGVRGYVDIETIGMKK